MASRQRVLVIANRTADLNHIHPIKEREIIRAAGPTVRDDLGKQATGLGVRPAPRIVEAPATSMPGRDNDVSI